MLILTLSYRPVARWKAELSGYIIEFSKGIKDCLYQALCDFEVHNMAQPFALERFLTSFT